jgi:hypothetical protein
MDLVSWKFCVDSNVFTKDPQVPPPNQYKDQQRIACMPPLLHEAAIELDREDDDNNEVWLERLILFGVCFITVALLCPAFCFGRPSLHGAVVDKVD